MLHTPPHVQTAGFRPAPASPGCMPYLVEIWPGFQDLVPNLAEPGPSFAEFNTALVDVMPKLVELAGSLSDSTRTLCVCIKATGCIAAHPMHTCHAMECSLCSCMHARPIVVC